MRTLLKPKLHAVAYHGLRALVLACLLMTGFCTLIYWSTLTSFAMTHELLIKASASFTQSEAIAKAIDHIFSDLGHRSLLWAGISLGLVGLFGLLPRARRSDKRFIVAAVVVVVFCAGATVLATTILRRYTADLWVTFDLY